MVRTLSLILALMLLGAAHAMPIRMDAGRLACDAVEIPGGDAVTLNVAEFQLLGVTAAGEYVLSSEGRFFSVPEETIDRVLRAVGTAAEELPAVPEKMTEKALNRLLEASLEEDIVYVMPEDDLSVAFGDILEVTDADLSKALAVGMTLKYDDVTGTGEISNGNTVRYSVPAATDADRCDFTLRFVMLVDAAGAIRPAVQVECLCFTCPEMREITMASGDKQVTLPVVDLTADIDGVNTIESGAVYMDDAALELLTSARKISICVACRAERFAFDVAGDMLPSVANVAAAARSLQH